MLTQIRRALTLILVFSFAFSGAFVGIFKIVDTTEPTFWPLVSVCSILGCMVATVAFTALALYDR